MKKKKSKEMLLETLSITGREALTLPGLFNWRVKQTPNSVAYGQFDSLTKRWRHYTWKEMGYNVCRWQTALRGERLQAGDRVGIYLKNCVEWVCFEQAALALGLVVVPLYSLNTPSNIAYILQDSGCKSLLIGSSEKWHALARFREQMPFLKQVIYLKGSSDEETENGLVITKADQWLPAESGDFSNQVADPEKLATIIYTSGTTGMPKGVMLSHRNILKNVESILQVVQAYNEDIFLSFLPLSHAFERTVGYYVPMMAGSQVCFARSIQDLPEDLLTIRPTVLISVPRIYERVYGRINEQLANKNRVARKLFNMTVEVGWKKFEASQGRGVACNFFERTLFPLLNKIVAKKVLDKLGGRLRLAVTGGAPLNDKVGRLFIGLGLPLLQGYGLTENAPVVSTNTLDNNMPESVGPPLPGVEVKVSAEKELLVRSASVMLGYWNRPEESKEAVDIEGWLHTGDMVEVAEQRIFIRGRLKDIIVTSTGEKIPPADLESAITEEPLFFQAMVIGEGKPFITALIVLHKKGWQNFALNLGLNPDDTASLQDSIVHSAVLKKLSVILQDFPVYAQVHAVHLSLQAWTFEEDLITSLMKLKRHEIEQRFSEEITAMYEGHHLPA